MKAWLIEKNADGKSALRLADVPDLAPGPHDLLVKVRAAGLNRADLGLNAGHFSLITTRPPQPIAGLEAAGEVIDTGSQVQGWAIGDRVIGMPSGAFAEQVVLDHRLAVRIPAALSWSAAAALPVALFTAHDAVVTQGRLAAGEAIFIQAASSGVGIAATQIARLRGAAVICGTASAAKIPRLATYGLTHGIDYANAGTVGAAVGATVETAVAEAAVAEAAVAKAAVANAVLAATNQTGANVIIDMVGAKAINEHLALAALGARWIQIGRMGGVAGPVDLNELARKRIALIGVTFRTRNVDQFAAVVQAAWHDLGDAVTDGRFAMPVEQVFPLAEADRAMQAMRENRHFGKFILET